MFKLLSQLKFLRGTAFDPFGHTEERRTERALIREYEETVERAARRPHARRTTPLAVQIASLPEEIRGYGHIKKRNVEAARKKRDELLARFSAAPPSAPRREQLRSPDLAAVPPFLLSSPPALAQASASHTATI